MEIFGCILCFYSIFTLLVHIEGVSFYVLWAYICSFIGLFFIKRMPFLILLPLIPLWIVWWLFYYGDSIEKWELCSYIRDGTRWNCECDGFILNYSQVWYCQWERLSCSVFTGSYMDPYIYEPISCEDYALPNKWWK